jgi:hypothetical protein
MADCEGERYDHPVPDREEDPVAVVRITFPDKKTVNSFAEALDGLPEMKRGAREVRRVLERYGWTAELTEPETLAAYEVREQMSPAARALAEDARARLDDVLESDRQRAARAAAAMERGRAKFGALGRSGG